ncbi:MAG TPA: hypothetical protein VJN71_10700 [Nitrososphaerales archaeon]|nr:hypothetical protein [Nitrososphaerales archaeon]
MGQIEASQIVRADKKELFFYGDWCYNVPEWLPPIKKTWIESLPRQPSNDGLGKITCYQGTLMGMQMEWKAKCVEWTECESWDMRAITGFPAKMNMHLAFRFGSNGPGETRVTAVMGFRAPYPLIGPIIDRFLLRKEAKRMVKLGLEGLNAVAEQHRIHPIDLQFEKRKNDFPGYVVSQIGS